MSIEKLIPSLDTIGKLAFRAIAAEAIAYAGRDYTKFPKGFAAIGTVAMSILIFISTPSSPNGQINLTPLKSRMIIVLQFSVPFIACVSTQHTELYLPFLGISMLTSALFSILTGQSSGIKNWSSQPINPNPNTKAK